eukprot:jgi/Psemu1/1435/gm1.1435_g
MRSKRVDQTAQNKREFRASNWKQELKKDFEKLDTYDGIQKVTNPVNKNSIKSALEYIENLKYTPMTNGVGHYFEFTENLFEALKQIDGYFMPIELRMQVAATQFCNCKNEGILMYMIHKKWVEKHISDNHRMMEQDWIDCKQHWNESLRDMYRENKRLKVKAEAGDRSVKEMAEKYMNTEQHTINLSKMKDGGKKRELEGMVDNIWKLKFCPKKGAECYFREFDALWEESHTTCDYDVPIEICMQKATCAILIAELPWNVTNKANLDWWNRMDTTDRENAWDAFKIHWTCRLEKIKVENNTKDLADDVVGDKRGDENEDETNPFFPDNEDDFDIDNNEKRNSPNKKKLKKAEEASKEENKSDHLEDETPEQSLERIAASHNMTVEELLNENKIFKDDNPENLPEKKIERKGRKKGITKNGKVEEDIMSVKEGDESQEERSTHREEEDKKNEEEAASERDPIENATDPALQLGRQKQRTQLKTMNGKKNRKHGKIIYQCCHHGEDKKKEKEAVNYTAQIAVARNPTLQEEDTDKNQEAAANDTDPIAVAADCVLQEDSIENVEE